METIYKGTEKKLTKKLIKRAIKEANINKDTIEKISVVCLFNDKLKLYEISIHFENTQGDHVAIFYSKYRIENVYSLTYMQFKKNRKYRWC